MSVPRHACWRDIGLTWRRPGALTADGIGLCRATVLGAALPRPDPWRGRAEYSSRRGLPPPVPEQPQQRSKAAAPARRRATPSGHACRLPAEACACASQPGQRATAMRTSAAAARYSPNVVSIVNKVSKISKV